MFLFSFRQHFISDLDMVNYLIEYRQAVADIKAHGSFQNEYKSFEDEEAKLVAQFKESISQYESQDADSEVKAEYGNTFLIIKF